MDPDRQQPELYLDFNFPKFATSDFSERISAACVNLYRKTFRLIPISPFALEPDSPTSGAGIVLDLELPAIEAEIRNQFSNLNHLKTLPDGVNADCLPLPDKEKGHYGLSVWDKAVCNYNFKDERLTEFIVTISLPIAIIFGWLLVSFLNFWVFNELDFRVEWAMLFLVSFLPFYRAAKVSAQDFFTLLVVHAILDAAAGTTLVHLYPHISSTWMSTLFDFFMFTNTIGSLQGFCLGTWFYVCVFTYVNHTLKGQFTSTGISWFFSIHAIGHAAYLGLGELLVQIILLRNCNFANPIFSLDKSEMIHKFRYLGLSGKLEAVVSISEENLEQCPTPKQGKRRQVQQQKKQSSPKNKSLSDIKPETHESLILRPSVGEIVDSFDLCIQSVEATSVTFYWATHFDFLYMLATNSIFIKEFDERDRVLSTASSILTVDDFETGLSYGEVMRKSDITLRINGATWPHWSTNKNYSAITLSNLHALTNYKITMAVNGFRSSPSFVTTLPTNLASSIPADGESAIFINAFNQLIELERLVHEERRLKKEEQLTVKKLRRSIAQQEASMTLELHQATKSLDRAKQEDGRMLQMIKSLKQSIQHVQSRISSCHVSQATLTEKIKDVEPRLTAANYRLSSTRNSLKDLRAAYRKMESSFQLDLASLTKEKQRQVNNTGSLEKRILRLTQTSILQVTEKIDEISSKLLSVQAQLDILLKQNNEIQTFLAQAESLGSWQAALKDSSFSSLLTETSHLVFASDQSDLSGRAFLRSLDARIASMHTRLAEVEKSISSYQESVESEGEFVGRLEAEERRILALVADRPKETDSGIEV